jgi:hypothetical protein
MPGSGCCRGRSAHPDAERILLIDYQEHAPHRNSGNAAKKGTVASETPMARATWALVQPAATRRRASR